jgi:hypothetical protein
LRESVHRCRKITARLSTTAKTTAANVNNTMLRIYQKIYRQTSKIIRVSHWLNFTSFPFLKTGVYWKFQVWLSNGWLGLSVMS